MILFLGPSLASTLLTFFFIELPDDLKVVSISPYKVSYWTRTAEIKTVDPGGETVSFFLKVSTNECPTKGLGSPLLLTTALTPHFTRLRKAKSAK